MTEKERRIEWVIKREAERRSRDENKGGVYKVVDT